MGCASSTPMIQTTGSEMLKAASHVASDATKTAEEAVEGVKDSVGKTLETAKDSVATTVESVKHEVETVVKDKTEMLEDAKNTLMEKLHLKTTESEGQQKHDDDDDNKSNNSNGNGHKENVVEHVSKTETDELKTQLNENLKHSIAGKIEFDNTADATKDIKEQILKRIDTETDSLSTSITEPEIEQAFAKSHDDIEKEEDFDKLQHDEGHHITTNLTALDNLKAAALKLQQQQEKDDNITEASNTKMVNDISMLNNNNDVTHKDNTNTKTLSADHKATDNVTKSNNMHKIPAHSHTAAGKKSTQTRLHSHHMAAVLAPDPLLPLTLATTAIATATAATTVQPRVLKDTEHSKFKPIAKAPVATSVVTATVQPKPVPAKPVKPTPILPPQKQNSVEKEKLTKPKVLKKEEKITNETEEKRPGTTEWEKFADMLAQVRKFNPQDAFRRGGTFSKFSTGGIGQLRERPSYMGHHMRGMDDDSSDTTSNFRGSPLNSQRSSARAGGRVQRLPNRPNTGNSRKNNHEFSNSQGGGRYLTNNKNRRNSNVSGAGRKFDFNPLRSRVHEFVSSTPFLNSNLQSKKNNVSTPLTTAIPYAPSNSFATESVKSPANLRSHHSRSYTRILPPLDKQQQELQYQQQHYNHNSYTPDQQQQYSSYDYTAYNGFVDHHNNNTNTSSSHDVYNNLLHEVPLLTRQSSNTSLFSNHSCAGEKDHHKTSSQQDVRHLTTNPPIKNTSSFLTTPRSSPFSIRKSYTDLYFSTTGSSSNKENKPVAGSELSSREKSPYKIRKRCDVCCKKYAIK